MSLSLRTTRYPARAVCSFRSAYPHTPSGGPEKNSHPVCRTLLLTLLAILFLQAPLCRAAAAEDPSAALFRQPPDAAKPWVIWYWMNGNITKEGITADLEAMHRQGIGGVLIMDIYMNVPDGKVSFMSPEWQEDVRWTFAEAARLGMEVDLGTAPGWHGTGGPWVTPEQSMQELTWSQRTFTGPGPARGDLPAPPSRMGFYKDIAVLAYPTPPGGDPSMAELAPKVTVSGGTLDAKAIFTGNYGAPVVKLPLPKENKPVFIQFEFRDPVALRSFEITGDKGSSKKSGEVQCSADGVTYTKVCDFTLALNGHLGAATGLSFSAPPSKFYRIVFTKSESGWADNYAISLVKVEVSPAFRIAQWAGKASMSIPQNSARDTRDAEGNASAIDPKKILNLTDRLRPDGTLDWQVPAGDWTVLRIGHTSTASEVTPAKDGLQADALSPSALRAAFDPFIPKLLADSPPEARKAVTAIHTDSWESGCQNWTPDLPQEFRRLTGYDLIPWLPVMTGRVVGSLDDSERVLWDLRQTLSRMLADRYFQGLADMGKEHGLKVTAEAYGQWILDPLRCGGRATVPMGEFWVGGGDSSSSRFMASAAHIYGHRTVAAESFTSSARAWQPTPWSLKGETDTNLCDGINKFIIHTYAHQPFTHLLPGMTMANFGLNIGRNDTWWDLSHAWFDYLARCSYMLQQGRSVADVLCLVPDDTGYRMTGRTKMTPPVPSGYDFDFINPEVLVRDLTVVDGRLTLPTGASYRQLRLPDFDRMSLPVLRKIRDLVAAGANVIGPRPSGSSGLLEKSGEEEFRKITTALWEPADGGKPAIIDEAIAPALTRSGILPDMQEANPKAGLRYIHRSTGSADIYFLSNPTLKAFEGTVRFRVTGKQPELWKPDTGTTADMPVYDEETGQTAVPLRLDPRGSVFVVFRKPGNIARIVRILRDGTVLFPQGTDAGNPDLPDITQDAKGTLQLVGGAPGRYELVRLNGTPATCAMPATPARTPVTGSWKVLFQSGRGAPAEAAFDRLISWPDSTDPGIKYFSGTATYGKTFTLPADPAGRKYFLDLGDVKNFAEVRVNDTDMGVLWKPPFRLDISAAIHPGENSLRVRVTNLWPNRLIGDDLLPEDLKWTDNSRLTDWPDWVLTGGPRPTKERLTFAPRKLWTKKDKLLPSGLIGPVNLEFVPCATTGK